jgi:hypothetical protein
MILKLIEQLSGTRLPQHFDHGGKRYPLRPVYELIETDSEAQSAALAVLAGGRPVPPEGEESPVDFDDEPVDVGAPRIPLPEELRLTVTGARYPNKLGGEKVDPDRLHDFLKGTANLNSNSRVWFDCTPEPDTVKEIAALHWRTRVCVRQQGTERVAVFAGLGYTEPRADDPSRQGVVADVDAPFNIGFGGTEYTTSLGFFIPIRFAEEGVYEVWFELDVESDLITLISNRFSGLHIS